MAKQLTPKRAAAGAPGAKLLITATAVAATLGGWLTLSALEPAPADSAPTATDTTLVIAEAPAQPPLRLNWGPIPTLVPPPPPQPDLAIGPAPAIAIPATRPTAPKPAVPIVVAQPAPAAPAPVVVAQPAPALRAVSAPPKPVARTRSSK